MFKLIIIITISTENHKQLFQVNAIMYKHYLFIYFLCFWKPKLKHMPHLHRA